MLVSFVYFAACRLFALVLLLARGDRSKELELLVVRHELSVLRRQASRPQLTASDRLVLVTLSRLMPRRSWQAFLPDDIGLLGLTFSAEPVWRYKPCKMPLFCDNRPLVRLTSSFAL